MKPILTHPSYDQLHHGVNDIAIQLIRKDITPNWVIGLTRGGLIPAVIFSHMMNDISVMPVSYSSTTGNGDNRNHVNKLPDIHGEITSGTGEAPQLPTLLIIDDICDSGRTLHEVYTHYSAKGHSVYTAALYYKEGAIIEPDFYWQKIPEDSPWIIFPFEK